MVIVIFTTVSPDWRLYRPINEAAIRGMQGRKLGKSRLSNALAPIRRNWHDGCDTGGMARRSSMSDFSDFRRRYGGDRFNTTQGRPLARRVRNYLATRPAESWLFFFAGIVAGAILG